MKEELQTKLVEILTSIQSSAGKASDFALEQLPDIAQSYVAYGRAVHSLSVLAGLVAIGVGVWLFARIKKAEYGDEPAYIFCGVAGVAVGFIFSATNISSALLVWFAPKVWLLKELARLVK